MTTTANGSKINLIMDGGGVRLSAYVGALAAFRDTNETFGAVAGASAGSIVGWLLAADRPVEAHLFQEGGHAFASGYPNSPTSTWIAVFEAWLARLRASS